ncbi:hypothetical protein Tco_1247016 [Tanacetum coccineum]
MTEEEVPTNFALMAFSDSEVLNNKTCSKTCLKSFEDLKSQYDNLRIELNKSKSDLANYKRGLASVEEQLVFYKKNEGMLCDQIAVFKRDASFNESEINALKIQIERLKKEKESNQIKIDNFENASKSLDKLIGSQISYNNRNGVGYNAVAPPPTSLFAPPTIDLSNSGLKEFKQPEFEGYGVKDEIMENVSANVQKPKQADKPRKVCQNPRNNTVLTKFDLVPISTARQSSSRTAATVSTARPIKTVAPKPFVNLNNKVNTVKVNFVNTAKGKRVTSAVGEQGIDVVKSKACWVWRPKLKAESREDIDDSMNILSVLAVYHTTNGHQFIMSNRQERIGYSRANDNWIEACCCMIIREKVNTARQILNMDGLKVCTASTKVSTARTATVKTVNDGEQQITVTVDGHKFAITEASVRRHLQLADVDGLSSLPNTEIFEQLSLMGKGVHVPLFDTMLLHDQPGQGEGPTLSVESQHTPTASSPSTSQTTTSQPTSLQAHSSHEPTTEPIITTSSPHSQETNLY